MNLFPGIAKIGIYKAPLRRLMKIKISADALLLVAAALLGKQVPLAK